MDVKTFVQHLADYTAYEKGYIFEQFALHFLKKIWEHKDKIIWCKLRSQMTRAELKELGVPFRSDKGDDIYIMTADEIFVVQVKFRSENKPLTYGADKLSHTMAICYAVCYKLMNTHVCNFTERKKVTPMIFANVDELGEYIKNAVFINNAVIGDRFCVPEKETLQFNLRPYQITAVERAVEKFSVPSTDEYQIVMPTGTGKSVVVREIIARLLTIKNKFLVITSRKQIVEQFLELLEFPDTQLLGVYDSKIKDLEDSLTDDKKTIYVTTFQSAKYFKDQFLDLTVIDESHHYESPVSMEIIDNIWSPKLFTTATSRSKNKEVLFAYSLYEAIKDRSIVDYQIIVNHVENISDYDLVANICEKTITENHHILVFCNSIENAEQVFGKIKAIFSNDSLNVYVDRIYGKDENTIRREAITNFSAAKFGVLVSVKTLTEGVDIPIANTVILADKKVSKIDIIQIFGRVLRTHPYKTMAKLIIPSTCLENGKEQISLVFKALNSKDFGDPRIKKSGKTSKSVPIIAFEVTDPIRVTEIKQIIYDSSLKRVWSVEVLKTFIATNNRLPKQYKNPDTEAKIQEGKLYQWMSKQRVKNNSEVLAILDAMGYVKKNNDEIWAESLKALTVFITKNKAYPSQTSKDPVERKLGTWVNRQRQDKNMNESRKKTLDAIGFMWSIEDIWTQSLEALNAFIVKNNAYPSHHSKDPVEKKLGKWVSTQRQGKNMNETRKNALDAIGFEWDGTAQRLQKITENSIQQGNISFQKTFKAVKIYVKKNNTLPNKRDPDPEIRPLGRWITDRKSEHSKGTLAVCKKIILENLPGFFWSNQAPFDYNIEFVKEKIKAGTLDYYKYSKVHDILKAFPTYLKYLKLKNNELIAYVLENKRFPPETHILYEFYYVHRYPFATQHKKMIDILDENPLFKIEDLIITQDHVDEFCATFKP